MRSAAALKDRDPLAYWHHSSEETRRCSEFAGQRVEVALRKPNKSGGTEWGAAWTLATLRGLPMLDGVRLPKVDSPIPTAVVGALDYRQMVQSVQPAYLRLLGDWPHRVTERTGEAIRTMRVRTLTSGDNERRWATVYFISQENPNAGVGYRCDLVHFDEPPVERFLREMRKAAYPGRFWARIITYTPLLRSGWYPLEQDFAGCMDTPYRGRVMVWLSDLTKCRHLSPRDIRELEDAYRGDPLARARMTGEPVDASGSSPWGALFPVLDAMEAEWATEPMERRKWQIKREKASAEGLVKVLEEVEVEVWQAPVAGRRCYLPIDPSLGVEGPHYDPGALHVCEWASGDLWARYNGYIGAYGLGELAAGLGKQYGSALVDPETTGGYGGPCLTALADNAYGNIGQQPVETRPGTWETQLGFQTTTATRPAHFAAIQEWLKAYRAGVKYARCPSREVFRSLKDVILDKAGRPVKAPGLHIEDVILWGQKLRKLKPAQHRAPAPRPAVAGPRIRIQLGGPTVPQRQAPIRMKVRPR